MSLPGGSEWFLIVLAVLVLFGAKKIPEFMKGLGKGIREFNDAKDNVRREIEDGINEKDTKKVVTTTTTPADTQEETVITHNADGSITKTITVRNAE